MSSTERLQRYVADECGSCTDEDLADRLAELEELNESVGGSDLATDIELLSALGNETRYKIVRMLHAADDEELCVCELSPLLDVSDSAISHALSQLTDAGLVTRRKEGKWRMYRATPRANAVLVALDGSRSL
ncbi:metalloregulator ArsR/SmtB family transcription factor [Halorubrum ezzemoulense]|jgi:DNA-binding transcriptional ArsR family regulator|uniref:Metalloregulator ArsR/SmtB family transcription factor n=1 Tax=Halorubrum ezzemoulense TaxID=337243 RepID=A0A256JMR4_HALEZ|nr:MULTISPECIES: metalloregulator ArsR/SmtB family transcription factor [Halorubrum]MDB2239522.1 metalloregulator ArsR/SmtB family transcription factor [Halorubrum ezzemoulense]MDB2242960.1 metalloregulator ArsR/SmtB family transcription factor [Halorubrum ezzemoulense]MDB2246488.1 metalloregulator ArsR/SmtB family transcription factor [Halorubrum ezzemoulense]MDB2249946.1 metalloregulator ArsR/SmtB family transcription factor [Halorubrum ezzemoulense]MDB2253204.1 metalloregulator ArsR/SmtB fa